MPGKDWAFRKFYAMREFEDAIPFFGSANWTSTAYGERSHKDFKAFSGHTNNREAHMDSQVRKVALTMCKMFVEAALRRMH